MRQPRTITEAERRAAARSLRTVGGVYAHIALYVERDYSGPSSQDSETGEQ